MPGLSSFVYQGMSGIAGYDGGLRKMSDGRLLRGRKALCARAAFFCTWCATARAETRNHTLRTQAMSRAGMAVT